MRLIIILGLLHVIAMSTAGAQSTTASESSATADSITLEEVLVIGEQPGPGLWKVSKGDHALWIVGTHAPLPKKMIWRSKQVEALVAESQEVIAPVKIDTDTNIGFFRAITLVPALLGAAKNPNDALLKDVVPADVYAKWLPLKEKYLGRDRGVEKWRPTFAAQELRSEAVNRSGLGYEPVVWPVVSKAAKGSKVKITALEVKMKLQFDEPRAALKNFRRTEFSDLECFAKTLDGLESDLETMKLRANAWSTGDIDALRRLTKTDPGEDCMELLQTAIMRGQLADKVGAQDTVANVKREIERVAKEAERKWIAAAESALASHRTTFAVLPIQEILHPKGYVAKLRALGYTVEDP